MTNQEAMETLNRMATATDRLGDIERKACELGVRVLLTTTPRPIETAPKNGTPILLSDLANWAIGWWADGRWRVVQNPTHWLPLPKSPEVQR